MRSGVGTRFARAWVPMKPHIARELAALTRADDIDDATIFRRTASEAMVAFARVIMAETDVDMARVVKVLKRIAIEFDQPVKVELIFDVIAALEIGSTAVARLPNR
jgi:hypothetical protein